MEELNAMAEQLNAAKSDDKMKLIYNIIDAEADRTSIEAPEKPAPKKRGRKSKAEKEAAALAAAENTAETENEAKDETPPALPDTETAPQADEKPAPKKRGRKSKAEKEAAALAEAEEKETPTESEVKAEAEEVPVKKRRKRIGETIAEGKIPETEALPVQMEFEEFLPQEPEEEKPMEGITEEEAAFLNEGENFIIIQDIPSEEEQSLEVEKNAFTPISAFGTHQQMTREDVPVEEVIEQPVPAVKVEEEPRFDFGENIRGEGVLELTNEGYEVATIII